MLPQQRQRQKMGSPRACPSCGEELDGTSELLACPSCWTLFDEAGRLLTRYDGGCYNFSETGFFSYLGKIDHVGEERPPFRSFRRRIRPTLDKLWGHLMWMLFWGCLASTGWLFFSESPWYLSSMLVVLGMMAFHLVLFGSYWSAVMMQGLLFPVLRPSPWESVTLLLEKGKLDEAEAAIERHQLGAHPGFLASLAFAYMQSGNPRKADLFLSRAKQTLPRHPFYDNIS